MKIAIVGSRSITEVNIGKYISECDEIVSGGALGVDACAAEYAHKNGIKLTEFLPQYSRFGRAAPIIRNQKIVDYSDKIIVFWDGKSKGTEHTVKYAQKLGKQIKIVIYDK